MQGHPIHYSQDQVSTCEIMPATPRLDLNLVRTENNLPRRLLGFADLSRPVNGQAGKHASWIIYNCQRAKGKVLKWETKRAVQARLFIYIYMHDYKSMLKHASSTDRLDDCWTIRSSVFLQLMCMGWVCDSIGSWNWNPTKAKLEYKRFRINCKLADPNGHGMDERKHLLPLRHYCDSRVMSDHFQVMKPKYSLQNSLTKFVWRTHGVMQVWTSPLMWNFHEAFQLHAPKRKQATTAIYPNATLIWHTRLDMFCAGPKKLYIYIASIGIFCNVQLISQQEESPDTTAFQFMNCIAIFVLQTRLVHVDAPRLSFHRWVLGFDV